MHSRVKNITGNKYGRLTVIKFSHSIPGCGAYWLCKCSCSRGTEKIVRGNSLKLNHTKSCGCYKKERDVERNTIHGLYGTYITWAWFSMKGRCYNKNDKSYKNYGGRGIKVCSRWKNSFENFHKDMGDKPNKKMTLERINNNGDYKPSNCKWATYIEQINNRRNTIKVIYKNKIYTLLELAKKINISYKALLHKKLKKRKIYPGVKLL